MTHHPMLHNLALPLVIGGVGLLLVGWRSGRPMSGGFVVGCVAAIGLGLAANVLWRPPRRRGGGSDEPRGFDVM